MTVSGTSQNDGIVGINAFEKEDKEPSEENFLMGQLCVIGL